MCIGILLRMFELLYPPFILLLISQNSRNNSAELGSITNSPCQNDSININSTKLLYNHPDPAKRCYYQKESQGPCGKNMKLYSLNATEIGECDCDISSPRISLYHNATNQCYPIYRQGYCNFGEQLVLTKDSPLVPQCKRTICYDSIVNSKNTEADLVPFNGTCVAVGSKCSDMRGFYVGFERDRVKPACIRARHGTKSIGAIGVPLKRCSPGTYRAITGHCQPPVFDFDDFD